MMDRPYRKKQRKLARIENHVAKELCEIRSRYNFLKLRIREERIKHETWQMYKSYEYHESVYEGHDYSPNRDCFDVKFEMGFTEIQIELTRRLVRTQFTWVTICALRILGTIKQQNSFLAICKQVFGIVNDIICSGLTNELRRKKNSLKSYALL